MTHSLMPDSNAENFFSQAVEHFEQCDYQTSIACCDQAIVLDPNHVNAWWLKGQAFQRMGEHQSALESFDRVIALEPEVDQVWELRSIALAELERLEEALASIDRAIALMPEDSQTWSPHYYRGHWLSMLERSNEATVSFEKAATLVSTVSPPNSDDLRDVWSVLGRHYAQVGQYEQAIAAYENAPFVLMEDPIELWLHSLLSVAPVYPTTWENRDRRQSPIVLHQN